MDPEGSCRIRRARGKVSVEPVTGGIGLPNNSGWMLDKDLKKYGKDWTAGKLKARFKEEFPNYASTIYPVGDSKATQSVWKNDPNSSAAIIKLSKALPMPPDRNATAVLTKDDENAAAGGGGKKAKPKSKKGSPNQKTKDKTYRDSGGEESQDEEPNASDVEDDRPQPRTVKKRKRKGARTGPATTVEPPTAPATTAAADNDGATQGTTPRRSKIKVVSRTTEEPASV